MAIIASLRWNDGPASGPSAMHWLGAALGLAVPLLGLLSWGLWRLLRRIAAERSQRERLQQALGRIRDGLALYDSRSRLIWCNDAYRALLGPEGTALRPGDPRPPSVGRGRREMHGSDGGWIAIDSAELEDGTTVSIIRDSGEQREADARLRADRERFHQFLSAAGGWIWETDVLHRFSVLTPVRPDIDPSDLQWLVGRHLAELPADGFESSSALESCLQDMAMQRRIREVTLWLYDGRRVRTVRLSGVPRFDAAGAFLGYRGIGSFAAAGIPHAVPHRGEGRAKPTDGAGAPAAASPDSRRSRRLLVAEDSQTNRLLARSILERMGYEVDTVENGRQAVEAAQKGDYGAILMDVWMPQLDGLAATAMIRALPEPKGNVPIVAMTAHAGSEDRERCLEAGMNEHVAKPIDRARLAEILGFLLGDEPARKPAEVTEGRQADANESALPSVVDDAVIAELRQDAGDSLVEELIAAYMAETDDRLARMASALEDGRLEEVGADAHAMKSSSGTFGALRLEALAAQLEAASTGNDRMRAVELMEKLPSLVSETWAGFTARGHAPRHREPDR